MRTQTEVANVIHRLYEELGFDAGELSQIKPMDGGWDNALSYKVTRNDGKTATIYRRDLDDNNKEKLKNSLNTQAFK